MSQQDVLLFTYTHKNNPSDTIEVLLNYNLGGMSYFTGATSERGYYLSATPVEASGGFKIVRAFSGFKMLVESAQRYSQKHLYSLAGEIIRDTNGQYASILLTLMNAVIKHNLIDLDNYTLKQESYYEVTV